MLRKGFLHRDVSIGNTLMLDPPVVVKPFETRTIEELMTRLSLQYEDELATHADLLGDMIMKMGMVDECRGFVIDGDMAAPLKDYFTSRDHGERSVSILIMQVGPTYDFHAGDVRVHVQRVGEDLAEATFLSALTC